MLERVMSALYKIFKTNCDDAAIVTHSAAIMCLQLKSLFDLIG